MGVLVVCGFALALTAWLRARRPSAPPDSAPLETRRAYWQKRIQDDVADTDAYLALGRLEERNGYYLAAVRALSAARALGASDTAVCAPLGRALTQLARDDEALPELEKAVRLAPGSAEAAVNLAGLYVNQDQPRAAAQLLEAFLLGHPALAPADSRRLALALLECGDTAAARRLAEALLQTDPDDTLARGIAARGALAARDLPAAQAHLETLLQSAPDDTGALYLYGNVLDARGEKEKALLQWQKVVAANPNALDAYERIADAYAARKDFTHAAVAYQALALRAPAGRNAARAAFALERTGQRERASYWKAIAAGQAARFDDALRWGKQTAASPDPALRRLGLQAMAEAYRGLRQREAYLSSMQRLTAEGSLDDLLLMARAWGQVDYHEKRTQWLQRAVGIAPAARKAGVLRTLAQAYHARGMRDEAEKTLEEALPLAPKDPALRTDLATLYLERRREGDRLQKALALRQEALALEPEDAASWQQLGIAYAAAGQNARAARCLEHAIDLEPGNGPAYLELSKAYASLGDARSAQSLRGLYAKYVAYEQNRQTLRTRAYRPGATVAEVRAYADLLYTIGALDDAAAWYEKALYLAPNDAALRRRLIVLYGRLRRVDRALELRQAEGKS